MDCVIERGEGLWHSSLIHCGWLDARAGSGTCDASRQRFACAAPLPNLALTGERGTFSHPCA